MTHAAFLRRFLSGPIAAAISLTFTSAVTPARTSGVAPLYVHFSTLGSTCSGTSLPFHEVEYVWSFGDAAGAFWAYGSNPGVNSKNAHRGPIAGHVFETAGTYTVTMTPRMNGFAGAPVTTVITVTAADAYFGTTAVTFNAGLAGAATSATLASAWALGSGGLSYTSPVTFSNGDKRIVTFTQGATSATWTGGLSAAATATATAASTICVSATGAATGAPAGAYVLTGSDWGVPVAYIKDGSTVRRVLCNKGESFTAAGTAVVMMLQGTAGAVYVGAYGTGAKPVFVPPAGEGSAGRWFVISDATTATMKDIRFVDIKFDATTRIQDSITGFVPNGGYDQFTMLRCDFLACDMAFLANYGKLTPNNTLANGLLSSVNNAIYGGHHMWDQWAMVDCTLSGASLTSLVAQGAYGFYTDCAERFFVAGNFLDVSATNTAAQGPLTHVMRLNYSYNNIISNTTATRPGASRHCLKLCSNAYKQVNTSNVDVGLIAMTFTAPPGVGALSATLSSNWANPSGTYTVQFSTTEQRQVAFTNGSSVVTMTIGPSNSNTASATAYPLITPYNLSTDPSNNGGGGTRYVHVADCLFSGDTSKILVDIGPPAFDSDGRGRDVIFERNYLKWGATTEIGLIQAWSNITLRNNFFDMKNGKYGEGIRLWKEQTQIDKGNGILLSLTPAPNGVFIYNNSFTASTAFSPPSFWAVNFADTLVVGAIINNNLAYSPLDSLHKTVNEQFTPAAGYIASNNSTTTQTGATSPLWATTPPAVVGDWLLQAGSYAKNAGADVPVWSDFFGNTRSSGSMDIGATEQ